MIYLTTTYSRRDPISIGLQSAFQPVFEMTDAMTAALRHLDADERRRRAAVTAVLPRAAHRHRQPVAVLA